MSLSEIESRMDALSLSELQELKFRVERKIESRADQERRALIDRMDAMARERGFAGLEALMAADGATPGRRTAPPKYRNPADPEQTWSGRGRRPNWVEEMLAAGGSLDEALIPKED